MKLKTVEEFLRALEADAAQGIAEVDQGELMAALSELEVYHSSLPADTAPPALKVWTVVQVNEGVEGLAGRVGVVQGGNGDALDIDLDGEKVVLDKSSVTKLA